MRPVRLFVPLPLAAGEELALPEAVRRHLVQVLRARPGQALRLFNGEGGEYPAELVSASRREARVRVLGFEAADRESPLELVLVQGIAKSARMDLALQKATELGVRRIVPLVCRRSVTARERLDRKREHWIGVVVSACEQSGRTRLPVLEDPASLEEYLARHANAQRLLLHPGERPAGEVIDTLDSRRPVHVLVGPEGGFDEHERERLLAAGALPLGLGPRVLRTETAALAALALLQHRLGDLG